MTSKDPNLTLIYLQDTYLLLYFPTWVFVWHSKVNILHLQANSSSSSVSMMVFPTSGDPEALLQSDSAPLWINFSNWAPRTTWIFLFIVLPDYFLKIYSIFIIIILIQFFPYLGSTEITAYPISLTPVFSLWTLLSASVSNTYHFLASHGIIYLLLFWYSVPSPDHFSFISPFPVRFAWLGCCTSYELDVIYTSLCNALFLLFLAPEPLPHPPYFS